MIIIYFNILIFYVCTYFILSDINNLKSFFRIIFNLWYLQFNNLEKYTCSNFNYDISSMLEKTCVSQLRLKYGVFHLKINFLLPHNHSLIIAIMNLSMSI